MKKLILTTAFAIGLFTAFAYNGNTRLVISGATSNNIKIFIDGYNVGAKYRNGNAYYIDDISTANHRIQILKQRTSIFGVNEDKIIYDQNVYLKANSQTNLSLTPFGTVEINETPIYGNNNGGGGGWDGSNNYPNNSPDWNGSDGNQPQCGNDKGRKNGHRKHHKRKKYYCDDDDNMRKSNDDWDN
jgi:hypothetical protein